MPIVSCTRLQAKRFFAALCYANQNINLFERQLVELPEQDWATVLLASIIIDNSGIAKVREDFMKMVTPSKIKASGEDPGGDTEKQRPPFEISREEYWVEVPNQYILQNRAWLNPVIRACDPEKTTFTEDDYGSRLLENLSDKLSVKLKAKGDIILVELSHSLEVISFILAEPELTGASDAEVESVLCSALTDGVFYAVKNATQLSSRQGREIFLQETDELSRGLIFLVIMTLLFAATGLLFGFYCASDADRDALIKIVP